MTFSESENCELRYLLIKTKQKFENNKNSLSDEIYVDWSL